MAIKPKSNPQSSAKEQALAAKEAAPVWLSVRDSAEYRGVHPNTIRNLIASGKLPAFRAGRNLIRINKTDLDALFTAYKGGEFGCWSHMN